MNTQITADHFAQRVMRPLFVCVRHVQMGTLGALLILAVGCDVGGGDSGGGQDTAAAAASAPVDLPPGQTTAMLAWTPSAGDVAGYYVLESRNDSSFAFATYAPSAEVSITGEPGERVRIQVIAAGRTDTFSAPSAPSAEMRFHASVEAATAIAAQTPNTIAAVIALPDNTPDSTPEAAADNTADSAADSAPEAVGTTDSATNEEADAELAVESDAEQDVNPSLIDPMDRARLMASDLRFPFRSHSQQVAQWLQSHVDVQIGGGLSLVGTGESNLDSFRELIWADQSGQLFVSDGAALAAASSASLSDDPTADFVEAIRLRATERFVGLADFDGDGIGDWLIEDSATFEVWMVNGETQETIAVPTSDQDESSEDAAQLAGHGDFDGDGRSELLWADASGSFRISRPTTALPEIAWLEASNFDSETSQLLTVADLNGDGRDDLLFLDADGRLQSALASLDLTGVLFTTSVWSEQSTDGLELIATLDLDGDGRSEIAWHDGVDFELWDAPSAP